MSATHQPRLANWLLRRFACGPKRESLIGDLDEQFARGRSSFWYWRQVLSAILFGVASDLLEHKLLAFQAAVITWAIVIPWSRATLALYLWVFHTWGMAWANHSWANHSFVLFEFWVPFGGGLCLIWCAGSAASGWVLGRLSGKHVPAMVVAGAVAQIPLTLWWSRVTLLHVADIAQFSSRISVPISVQTAIVLIGMPICTVLGGLWGARPERDIAREPQSLKS